MVPLSVLDLSPITVGSTAADALQRTTELARHVERLGFRRFWLAEHHGIPSVASAATAVVMAHVAGATSTIRVGAGGIMLPNHAPLVVAEQFGTLESLFPGRIDLGLGRAPGADPITARALRRTADVDPEGFPDDVRELLAYFRPASPGQAVTAIPGAGLDVPVWILGSSLFGAQTAAALGLPYAFASHFAPTHLHEALALYRRHFRPSPHSSRPHVMAAVNVFVAEREEDARLLFSSLQQAFVALRRGAPAPLPPPREGYAASLAPEERTLLERMLAASVVGTPEQAAQGLEGFARDTGADEIIVASQIYDHHARLRSFELTAHAAGFAQ